MVEISLTKQVPIHTSANQFLNTSPTGGGNLKTHEVLTINTQDQTEVRPRAKIK